ncbi:hypothetical protein CMUS01_07558 [Colletotrichum musicola]|uniref:Uncharacterized protein n=1 Tax=Colletotrichum musicola TaxID=2175873 RepID=A0A8H6NFH5_9PEZI|nr:hypothetical protein CMUS01_07558 [Colletotrichum musicola]
MSTEESLELIRSLLMADYTLGQIREHLPVRGAALFDAYYEGYSEEEDERLTRNALAIIAVRAGRWFDTKWDEVAGYERSYRHIRYSLLLPDDRRWSSEEIDARGQELCSRGLDSFFLADMAALYDHLHGLDEALRHIRDNWPCERFKTAHSEIRTKVIPNKPANSTDDEYEATYHVDLARKLLRRHKRIRSIVRQRSRPHLRPLGLGDMPQELIDHIMGYVDAFGGSSYKRKETFESLRLTSRAVSAVSTPYLFRGITIYPTRESLDRLDYVSRHPLLSKSIRSAKVSVAYYRRDAAQSPDLFIRYASRRCLSAFNAVDPEHGGLVSTAWGDDAALLRDFNDEWEKLLTGERDGHLAWEAALRECPLTKDAYEAYKRKYAEYGAIVKDGGFAGVVADAVARMPNVADLVMGDHTIRRIPAHYFWELSDDSDEVRGALASPVTWEMMSNVPDDGEAPQPASVVAELLSALGSRRVRLSRLYMCVTLPADLKPLRVLEAPSGQHYRELTRELTSFVLSLTSCSDIKDYREEYGLAPNTPRPAEDLAALDSFLGMLLDSQRLAEFNLSLEALEPDDTFVGRSSYLPSLMKARPWPELREMALAYVRLDSRRLGKLLGRRPLYIRELFSPRMERGTWTQALDVMRERYDRDWSPGDPLRDLKGLGISDSSWYATGAEAGDMSRHDYRRVFGDERPEEDGLPQSDGWKQAVRYVRREQDENPCRRYIL